MKENKENFFVTHLPTITLITLPILLVSLGYSWYKGNEYIQNQEIKYSQLQEKVQNQENLLTKTREDLTNTTSLLTDSIQIIEDNISLTKTESQKLTDSLSNTLSREQEKVSSLQKETEKIGGTVGTLEKLSQTDKELLQKYSKVFFLNEHYVPSDLSEILNKYLYSEQKTQYIHTNVSSPLTKMIDAATADGVTLYVKSAYRSFNEQDNLKSGYTVVYGEKSANQFSADQGYSEHQLGTTVDLITTGLGGELSGFDKTKAYTWLQNNAYKYGFILSYPKGNQYYTFEPWHWRFVGKTLAQKIHDENLLFYNMEQRKIDEYLVSIFD